MNNKCPCIWWELLICISPQLQFYFIVQCYHETFKPCIHPNQRNNDLTRYVLNTFILISFCKSYNISSCTFWLWFLWCAGSLHVWEASVSIASSCPVTCINMKCQCIIDETNATFTVCTPVCARSRGHGQCRACHKVCMCACLVNLTKNLSSPFFSMTPQ